MSSISSIKLSSGAVAPILAYGTGTARYGGPCTKEVSMAIKQGFRHIDAAEFYANEKSTGDAIQEALSSGTKRSDLFVLTKMGSGGMKNIPKGGRKELEDLQCEYLDCLLLHFPPRGQNGLPSNVEAWKQMEKLKDDGITKAIGVSNWLASDIEEVLASNPKHKIEINQIEYNPSVYHSPQYATLLSLMKREGIVPMTYAQLAPITSVKDKAQALHPILSKIAEKHSISEGGVLLKWTAQRSGGIITTTTAKPERAREYLELFEVGKGADRVLSEEELKEIDEGGKAVGVHKVYMKQYFE